MILMCCGYYYGSVLVHQLKDSGVGLCYMVGHLKVLCYMFVTTEHAQYMFNNQSNIDRHHPPPSIWKLSYKSIFLHCHLKVHPRNS